ncbi:glycoside hydrolase family 2 TIM barrel-domain containing protein [Cellulomonas endophytica]|uniref:glycoside hydrolase family 2 TIM barrel-domain containing protein n=1 Tax=Cellulomonas endophytica TaxID=2494735 RepID=UPI0010121819|nr:glycoside hydrolase family 2 TIM barrel-domain containing protein [Cellulomonas endophytica]
MHLSTTPRPTDRSRPVRWRALAVGALVAALGVTAVAPAVAGPAPAATSAGSAPTFDADYLRGVSGPEPLRTVNLAGTWNFTPITNTVCTGGGRFGLTTGPFLSCEDTPASGERTRIRVPGGGWLKQGWEDLSRAVYQRTIAIPMVAGDQVTKLHFGAVNHRATVSVDGEVVSTQMSAYTDSVFDLTGFVEPGRTHRIEVLVEGRKLFVGDDGRYTVPEGASWSDDVAQGIFRSADLEIYPAVHVADTFVRTSVADGTVTYDVTLTNSTGQAQKVDLTGSFSSWNQRDWKYPAVPTRHAVVPAGTTTTITVGPLRWRAGADSYWLPNLPYQEGYTAQLHELDVRLTARPQGAGVGTGAPVSTSDFRVRFGFRELRQVGAFYELNGVRINFRGDSLQGANYDNIDHHGVSDAFDTLPGFRAPTRDNPGWPQAVRNYQRLNYNSVRIHQIPATPYMLDVADELGLIIQDETAIRGSNDRQNFEVDGGRPNMVDHLADLVLRDRNHASVLRWSQANEPEMDIFDLIGVVGANPGAGPEFDELLYRTVKALDPTRPISTDGDSADLPQHDDYTVFCHYQGDQGQFAVGAYTENVCDVPGKPNGQGEFLWNVDHTPQGFTWFATAGLRMREKGAEDTRPYTLLNAWTSVIPGVERTDFTSIEREYPNGPLPLYGEDNLADPWSNPQIQLLQKAFNPVAAVDTAFWADNRLSDALGRWPLAPTTIPAGATTRTLTVFNDTLAGDQLEVTWELHAGTADGRVLQQGAATPRIAPGTRTALPITFDAPAGQGLLHLEVTVAKPGQGVLFTDSSTVFQVSAG